MKGLVALLFLFFLAAPQQSLSVCEAAAAEEALAATTEDTDTATATNAVSAPPVYGTDVSWPMHHVVSTVGKKPAPDSIAFRQQQVYNKFMQGCIATYNRNLCTQSDRDRLSMNLAQPAYQTNFTHSGYAKLRAPDRVIELLQSAWEGAPDETPPRETWPEGNIYTNHWEVPTQIVSIRDNPQVEHEISERVQDVLEAWSGQSLVPTSMYGIRVYRNQSILAPHVDRLPLVLSAIIHVAQEIKEDWILEVIGHDGIAVNLTMAPGDMVMYESHSVLHGRPYPFQGNYYANMFLHFEPVGYTANLEKHIMEREKHHHGGHQKSAKELFEATILLDKYTAQPEQKIRPNLPSYIEQGTQQAMQWFQDYVFYRTETVKKKRRRTKGVREAHILAAGGNVESLKEVAAEDPESLHAPDSNGWKPIHEAARGGRVKVLEYLLEEKADVNDRTNDGQGGSPLWWAEHVLPENHPAAALLRRHGGVAIGPHQ